MSWNALKNSELLEVSSVENGVHVAKNSYLLNKEIRLANPTQLMYGKGFSRQKDGTRAPRLFNQELTDSTFHT